MNDNEQMEFLYELFDCSLPRLGPGDDCSTKQALNMLLSARPQCMAGKRRVLDIGCGNGAQTIQLAGHIDGTILAVDNHQPFLDELQRRAEAEGVSDKVQLSGGLLAASELTWLRPDSPTECRQFFDNEYPSMVDIDTNLATIKSSGYNVVGHFTLPESAWWDSYYNPLEKRLQSFRKKYVTNPERIEMIDSVQMEIDIYRKYSIYYGYVFFLMQHNRL
jgi:trans-aconitate methyltransferase